MKKILFVLMLLTFSNSFAKLEDKLCMNVSKTFFPVCEKDLSLFYFKGQCLKTNEVEDVYCSTEEMTNLKVVQGEVMVAFQMPNSSLEQVFLHGAGQMVASKQGVASNCKNADVLIGQSKAALESNDPSLGEIGLSYVVIKFKCQD